jgi:hypothetical protein
MPGILTPVIGFDRPMRLMLATEAELIRQVRAAEDSDRDCERWPRDKPTDNATVVYWHCG